ncbi:MAG: hypothetical protein JSS79_07520 [Bacteroidetes bacterium]|nr:hypothetical protein [Bacteroidota bacterium]
MLILLDRHNEAINTIDGFLRRGADSTILLTKGSELEKIHKPEDAMSLYRKVYGYSYRVFKAHPGEPNAIYFMLLSKSKVYGIGSIQSEVNEYLEKSPEDKNLKALLTSLQN